MTIQDERAATNFDDNDEDEPYTLRMMMSDDPGARVLASVVLSGGVDDQDVVHLCIAYGGYYWACTSCEAQGMDEDRASAAFAALDPEALARTWARLRAALPTPDVPDTPAREREGVTLAGLSVPGGKLPRVSRLSGAFEWHASEWHASLGQVSRSHEDEDEDHEEEGGAVVVGATRPPSRRQRRAARRAALAALRRTAHERRHQGQAGRARARRVSTFDTTA